MTAHIINAALRSHGLMPIDGYCHCPCCDDHHLGRDEFPNPEPWMLDLYGGPVCFTCADNHPECAVCGSIVTPDEAVNGMHWYCSEDHCADQDAEHRCDEMREGVR